MTEAGGGVDVSGMPARLEHDGADPDMEFTKMQVTRARERGTRTHPFPRQLDFLDSHTMLSLEQFQHEWNMARYGGTQEGEGDEGAGDEGAGGDAAPGSKKRPTKKKASAASAAKKAKKERMALPPLREHSFGDLSRFAPPPKNPASSFMQFSRRYRAGKERGKAPNARHVSETWNQMSEEQRRPFVELAEEDKKRVNAEIDVYMAQYPEHLKDINDYKLLVSVMREKEKRDRGKLMYGDVVFVADCVCQS